MSLKKFTKDPEAVLDYTIDWSDWLAEGDAITAVTTTPAVNVSPSSSAAVNVDSASFTATETTLWCSGGTAPTSYDVVAHVTTSGGRQDDRTITLTCKEL